MQELREADQIRDLLKPRVRALPGHPPPARPEVVFERLRIASTWGWSIPQEKPPYLSEHQGKGALRDGRPVVYRLP